jgi:Mpv17 / PMP22 family
VSLLEGRTLREAAHRARRMFWPTIVAGTAFWPVANIANFALVPPRLRVLYVGILGLVWNAYLSWANSSATVTGDGVR